MTEHQTGNSIDFSRLGRLWTLANMLSMLRIVLVIPITVLIWNDGPLFWLFGLVLFGVATDWFDGRVARWSKTVSDWGKVLDPLADKVAAAAVVGALTFRPVEPSLPLWFLLLVVGRDVLVVLAGVVLAQRTGHVAMSMAIGKLAVTGIAFTVLAALLKADPPILEICIWVTAVLYVIAFIVYGFRYARIQRRHDTAEASGPTRIASGDDAFANSMHQEGA